MKVTLDLPADLIEPMVQRSLLDENFTIMAQIRAALHTAQRLDATLAKGDILVVMGKQDLSRAKQYYCVVEFPVSSPEAHQ